MIFEDALFAQLSGFSGLAALVSSKIYPDYVPQQTAAPYLRYFEVYREKKYVFSGYNGTSIFSIQISVYATTRTQARFIADQVPWPWLPGRL